MVGTIEVPSKESPYGSVPALKVLYKKLQDFAKAHNEKYEDVPNAQFSASDMINLMLVELLLQLMPNDREVLRVKRDSAVIEHAIRQAIAEILSSSKGPDNSA